jgi:hypothetical protein
MQVGEFQTMVEKAISEAMRRYGSESSADVHHPEEIDYQHRPYESAEY